MEANGTTRYYSLIVRLDSGKIVTNSGEDYKNWAATFLVEKHGAIISYICEAFPVVIVNVSVTQIKTIASRDFVLHLGDGEAKGSLALDVSVPTIRADVVHALGYTGLGVNVAVLDTGIDDTHPIFAGKNIVWRDFVNNQPHPYDDHGHGTHCASIATGDDPRADFDGDGYVWTKDLYILSQNLGKGPLD